MKIIFKIARAELRTLFYSPIAWIIIVVFFVVSGSQFVTPLMNGARVQELQQANNPNWTGFEGPLTLNMFIDTLNKFLEFLFMFIPLITMGVINREVNTGTMKLLSSSPVRTREIVFGKFLGLMLFSMILLSSVALLLFTGYFSIQHAEFNWYLSILLGLFLLSATYMAIGLFISSLTNYQIVAGLATFLVLMLLSMVGEVGQKHDFVRDITYFLSLAGRTETMIMGLITTRDLCYFILVITLFLLLTIIKLKSRQESKKWTISFYRYMGVTVIILTLGYFSSRPGYVGYLDVTRDKRNTIDTATQKVLKELDGSPITVTLYANLLGGGIHHALPVSRNNHVWGFWDKYVRFYPNINMKYEYYYGIKEGDSGLYRNFPNKNVHQIAKQMARMLKVDTADFKQMGEIDKLVDQKHEDELRALMVLEYKGNKAFLRTNPGSYWPIQPNVSASMRKLTRGNLPQLKFTTGHYERSPWRNGEREYGRHTNLQASELALINNGMESDTLSVARNEIPDSTSLLVIADPKSKLEVIEQEKILQYIENGGNALIYAEARKQDILNPILNKLGVNLERGMLVKPRMHQNADLFIAYMTKPAHWMAREKAMQESQATGKIVAGAIFSSACNISFKDSGVFKIEPIITLPGNEKMWIENGVYVADSAAPIFSPAEGDVQKAEYILAVRLTRTINNKEQRIVVFSDADFMAPNHQTGLGIGVGMYSWLRYNDYPVYIDNIQPKDIFLSIGKNPAKLLWYLYVYVLPGCLLLTGTIILIRRKRK